MLCLYVGLYTDVRFICLDFILMLCLYVGLYTDAMFICWTLY